MSFLRPKRVLTVATRCVMRIVSLLSMWVRLIVDNFRVYDEMNNCQLCLTTACNQPLINLIRLCTVVGTVTPRLVFTVRPPGATH